MPFHTSRLKKPALTSLDGATRSPAVALRAQVPCVGIIYMHICLLLQPGSLLGSIHFSVPSTQPKACPILRAGEPPSLSAKVHPSWRGGDEGSAKSGDRVIPCTSSHVSASPPLALQTDTSPGVSGPVGKKCPWLVRGPPRAGRVLIHKAPSPRVVTMVQIPGLNSETLGRGSRKVWTTEKSEAGKNTQQSWDKSPSHPA